MDFLDVATYLRLTRTTLPSLTLLWPVGVVVEVVMDGLTRPMNDDGTQEFDQVRGCASDVLAKGSKTAKSESTDPRQL